MNIEETLIIYIEGEELFSLGRTLITPGAKEALEEISLNGPYEFSDLVILFFMFHSRGYGGDVSGHDLLKNNFSVKNDLRILSAYKITKDLKIWVITEADRSATKISLAGQSRPGARWPADRNT